MPTFPQKFKTLKEQKQQLKLFEEQLREIHIKNGYTRDLEHAYKQLQQELVDYDVREKGVKESLKSKVEADAKLSMGLVDAIKSGIENMISKTVGFATLLVGIFAAFYGKYRQMVHDWQYPDYKYGGVQRNARQKRELRKIYNKEVSPDSELDPVVPPTLLASTNQYNGLRNTSSLLTSTNQYTELRNTPDRAANYDGMNDNFTAQEEAPMRPNGTTGHNNGHPSPAHH